MKVFIAGPMRGYKNYNYDAFDEAEERLIAAGFDVINPASNFDGDQDLPWEAYLCMTKWQVEHNADIIATLDGWEKSEGANIEIELAKSLGKPVIPVDELLRKGFNILIEAMTLVHGARGDNYGHPYDDYKCCVDMFNALMDKKYGITPIMKPQDGVLFMMCVKLSREANCHKRDNMVDLAGYAECMMMVEEVGQDD